MTLNIALFAGPGGSCEGIHQATGVATFGVENNADAEATRTAAGHPTLNADLFHYDPPTGWAPDGLWSSPPCQGLSSAGSKAGRSDLELLVAIASDPARWNEQRDDWNSPLSQLVVNSLRWVRELQPRWVAFEQVPAILPVWEAALPHFGYPSGWVGILNANDYGVPQDRKRAILMAGSDTTFDAPPEPTAGPRTMHEALGWSGLVGFPRRDDTGTSPHGYRVRDLRPASRPSFTVTSKSRSWKLWTDSLDPRTEARQLHAWEAGVLQGFRPDYPWQGSRTSQFQQVADAVAPPMAQAVVAHLTGHNAAQEAA